jgi:hypothetical protein
LTVADSYGRTPAGSRDDIHLHEKIENRFGKRLGEMPFPENKIGLKGLGATQLANFK